MGKTYTKIQNYIDKYNTPRVFQIFSTILFIIIPGLMFEFVVFKYYDAFSPENTDEWMYKYIFGIFYDNFGSFAATLAKIIVVVAAIAGIVFIWLNRSKIAGVCGGMVLLIMLLSLLRKWDFDGYYVVGDSGNYTFYHVSVMRFYYFLWALMALLAIFIVLSIVFTKEGPRQSKVVAVVQSVPQNQFSSADEIKKLKDLCDSGVITQEEFDTKKKEILGL